jgi:translocator protein
MNLYRLKKLGISIVLPFLAGGLGSLFTVSSVSTWYVTLEKPALNPPSWVFGPVWSLLYLLMGVSLYLVWISPSTKLVRLALGVFALQLVLNANWSVVFFGLQSPGLALLNIILLWLAIVWTILKFHQISRIATYLLVPYLAWVSFAMYLNLSIFVLN